MVEQAQGGPGRGRGGGVGGIRVIGEGSGIWRVAGR